MGGVQLIALASTYLGGEVPPSISTPRHHGHTLSFILIFVSTITTACCVKKWAECKIFKLKCKKLLYTQWKIHTVKDFTHSFVTTLSQIYALWSVKFLCLKLRFFNKFDKYQLWTCFLKIGKKFYQSILIETIAICVGEARINISRSNFVAASALPRI